jgi:D-aspartate ligase
VPKIQSNVPVVVVEGTLNSLGVVRSLSYGRMPIYLLATSRFCAAGWSRLCTFVRVPSLEGPALINGLMELGSRLRNRPVLILTGDECVDAVSSSRDKIEPLYRISLPSVEMVRALADKSLFQELAKREEFHVPLGVALGSTADLNLLQNITLPVIIKPADKKLVNKNAVERAVRVNTLAEAQTAATRMLERAPQIVVQEWIDGPDAEIFFSLFSCDRHSNLIGIFSGRKVVCSPPGVGSTAVCVAAPEESAELSALVSHFIASVGYRGLGSLEFKRDNKTRRFMIIEPTVGRTDWQEEIATLCGVNLPLITYWSELGRPIVITSGMVKPIAWRSSIEHRIPSGAVLPGTTVVDGAFRWSDPLPALYYYVLERFAARTMARVALLFHRLNGTPETRADD